jgi:hypothetical protein
VALSLLTRDRQPLGVFQMVDISLSLAHRHLAWTNDCSTRPIASQHTHIPVKVFTGETPCPEDTLDVEKAYSAGLWNSTGGK